VPSRIFHDAAATGVRIRRLIDTASALNGGANGDVADLDVVRPFDGERDGA
jgi:hypothetical protein